MRPQNMALTFGTPGTKQNQLDIRIIKTAHTVCLCDLINIIFILNLGNYSGRILDEKVIGLYSSLQSYNTRRATS